MPRCAREKDSNSIYHIMVKSVGGTLLFSDNEDKNRYLKTLKKYQDTYAFKIYAYCLVDTHGHMIIDASGADVSKFMHGVNQSYAQYYNRRHNRRGHLFADRFKSIIVESDRYLITLSGYIHNNPDDLPGFKDNVEKYAFSSLGVYLGLRKDNFELVDHSFILQLFSKTSENAEVGYLRFVKTCNAEELKKIIAFKDEKAEYRSERRLIARNIKPEKVVRFISDSLSTEGYHVRIKHVRDTRILKSLSAFMMRGFCDMKQRDISDYMGNITQSYASKLCSEGYRLVNENLVYKDIFLKFINKLPELAG
jgi:putative transposase